MPSSAPSGEVGQEQPPGQYFPGQALGYFDKIGRSLKEGEAVEFSSPEGGITATLTKEIRRRLVRASSDLKELTEEVSIRGVVPEADQDDMTFEVQLIEGRKVKAPIAPQHLDTILEAFNGYQAGLRVLLQGIGRFSRSDRLLGFDSIEHLSILDALDVQSQLEELATLQDGWIEGFGQARPKQVSRGCRVLSNGIFPTKLQCRISIRQKLAACRRSGPLDRTK